ncbi:MAG: ribosome recycling factor [Bacteroidales bacterium]|nr:ribosome recycling factor [Bacteroidales bacterium]
MLDTNKQLLEAEKLMKSTVEYLDDSLARIRAGKANVRILDGIRVDYYGSMAPLSNVATLTTPDPKTIAIQPWEKAMIPVIEKAIQISNVGITPVNNGEIIRLVIPPLTEERRKQLVKQARAEGEEAKISIRNARRDVIDTFKKMVKEGLSEDLQKDAEEKAQKLHDKYVQKVDDLLTEKENEIMTV